jgi:hypothetical protein
VDLRGYNGEVPLALLVQNYLLYWYNSTNTDANGLARLQRRGSILRTLETQQVFCSMFFPRKHSMCFERSYIFTSVAVRLAAAAS